MVPGPSTQCNHLNWFSNGARKWQQDKHGSSTAFALRGYLRVSLCIMIRLFTQGCRGIKVSLGRLVLEMTKGCEALKHSSVNS